VQNIVKFYINGNVQLIPASFLGITGTQ